MRTDDEGLEQEIWIFLLTGQGKGLLDFNPKRRCRFEDYVAARMKLRPASSERGIVRLRK